MQYVKDRKLFRAGEDHDFQTWVKPRLIPRSENQKTTGFTRGNLYLSARTHILKIKEQTSFGQTFQKIKKIKSADFVLIDKAKSPQMLAALILKLAGRKFFWIQNFSNPPVPSLLAKMLISQADNIVVESKKDLYKLKSFGISPAKIQYKKI